MIWLLWACFMEEDGMEGLPLPAEHPPATTPFAQTPEPTPQAAEKMKVQAEPGRFSATGSFRIKQSDFGIEPFSAMMGALKNRDEVKFSIKVEGRAQ
jgi:hypothetical protein